MPPGTTGRQWSFSPEAQQYPEHDGIAAHLLICSAGASEARIRRISVKTDGWTGLLMIPGVLAQLPRSRSATRVSNLRNAFDSVSDAVPMRCGPPGE